MENPIVVLVTVPSQKEGERIARKLVENRLAACVNIIPHLLSIYRWEGKIEEEGEFLLVLKTAGERFSELREKIKRIHSYSVPEILALPVLDGNTDYMEWVYRETRAEG